MRIKKFNGTTLKEATDGMKEELGPEAIILNTRKVHKGGILNFLGKEEFEITAAIDEQATNLAKGKMFAHELAVASGTRKNSGNGTLADLQKMADAFEQREKETSTVPHGPEWKTVGDYQELKSDLDSLKVVLHEMASHIKHQRMPALPELLKRAYANLVDQNVDEDLAAKLTQSAYRKLGDDALRNQSSVDACILQRIASVFKTSPSPATFDRLHTIVFVGPTGVGKTTTIAKLAAIYKLINKQDVALISADTYRVGAIEQLRTFAAIAEIPMEVVYEPGEMKTTLDKFSGKDVVFIDTVGRSQRSKSEIDELARFVDAAQPDEVHLLLNISTNDTVLREVVENFKPTNPNRIIFTKLDEAATFGQMLNIAHTSGIPISYLTTGQSVPDDISVASNVQLAKMVFAGEVHV